MYRKEITFRHNATMTPQLAAEIMREAEKHTSKLWAVNGNRHLRMDSLMSVLAIDPVTCPTLTIESDDDDGKAAVDTICAMLEKI